MIVYRPTPSPPFTIDKFINYSLEIRFIIHKCCAPQHDNVCNFSLTHFFYFFNKGAEGVLWPCKGDDECSAVTDAKCSSKFQYCYCPAGRVFSSDVTQCLLERLNDETCTDPVQCSHMVSLFLHF